MNTRSILRFFAATLFITAFLAAPTIVGSARAEKTSALNPPTDLRWVVVNTYRPVGRDSSDPASIFVWLYADPCLYNNRAKQAIITSKDSEEEVYTCWMVSGEYVYLFDGNEDPIKIPVYYLFKIKAYMARTMDV
jgi:hypothetical protein